MLPRLESPVLASRLASALSLSHVGDDVEIRGVSPLSALESGTLSFATREPPAELPPGTCILSAERPESGAWLRTDRARLDFVKALLVLERLGRFARAERPAEIHPSVVVSPGVVIGKNVVIGAGTRIEPNVTIADNTRIGEDCWLKSGCVIGEPGFGFERDGDGTPLRMLHFGGVVIGDRVEVGSVTTVCRGTLGPTIVEDDAKIDDHVHVAHNVVIRKNALVIACAELSGGVEVGEAAWVGPNASVLEKVKIGPRALVGLAAVVLRDVPEGATVVGNPARELVKKK